MLQYLFQLLRTTSYGSLVKLCSQKSALDSNTHFIAEPMPAILLSGCNITSDR